MKLTPLRQRLFCLGLTTLLLTGLPAQSADADGTFDLFGHLEDPDYEPEPIPDVDADLKAEWERRMAEQAEESELAQSDFDLFADAPELEDAPEEAGLASWDQQARSEEQPARDPEDYKKWSILKELVPSKTSVIELISPDDANTQLTDFATPRSKANRDYYDAPNPDPAPETGHIVKEYGKPFSGYGVKTARP